MRGISNGYPKPRAAANSTCTHAGSHITCRNPRYVSPVGARHKTRARAPLALALRRGASIAGAPTYIYSICLIRTDYRNEQKGGF